MAPKVQKAAMFGEDGNETNDGEMGDQMQGGGISQEGDIMRRNDTINETGRIRAESEERHGHMRIGDNMRIEGSEEERTIPPKKPVRKRSRMNDKEEKEVSNEMGRAQADKYEAQMTMKELRTLIKQGGEGQRLEECFSTLSLQILELTTAIVNLQEEKLTLQEHIIFLQQASQKAATTQGVGGPSNQTYAQAAQKGLAKAVASGVCLPPPVLPETTKHAPAEQVILYKAEVKGVLPTRAEQETFRTNVKKIIGSDCMNELSAIRATRHGGYTMIFRSEASRDEAMNRIQTCTEAILGEEKEQRIIAPKKKVAKMVCRDPPENFTHMQILSDFYGRHNPLLAQVAKGCRIAKIFETRLGWVFELSSQEAASIEAQGNRVRYGHGREMRMEEFIPLQQCYRCCLFGHNARDCNSESEHCRLCGAQGHSGKDCKFKEDRKMWKCANCSWNNKYRGTRLPEDHAAAQLHRCAVAQNEKAIRKSQLATAGVFTTPLKHFVPRNNQSGDAREGPQQIGNIIQPVAEDTQRTGDIRQSPTTTTLGGAVGGARRRTPSLQLARCYVPPTSSTGSSMNNNQNRNNEPLQLRPAGPPTWKAGQQSRGRMTSRGATGRGRGRESAESGNRTNSNEPPSQQQSMSSSSSFTGTTTINPGRANSGGNNSSNMTMGNANL